MGEKSYTVSARKFRPQTFKDVFGQEHISNTLKNAITSNRLAQSYLFCGPRGVGKTTCARIFAKAINCSNILPEGEPCNNCKTCKQFNSNNSVNIFELDAASNNSVDNIRQLNEQVRVRPMYGKYKVYIIDEVHMLSQGAFNAFLKTLEEPPNYAFFILATTEKQKILATILSRCQIFDFKRIAVKDMVKQMKNICEQEKYHYEDDALNIIANKSDGCMRDALSLMDSLAGLTNYNLNFEVVAKQFNLLDNTFFTSFFTSALKQDLPETIAILRKQYENGHEIELILESLCHFLRDIMLIKTPKGNELITNEKQKETLLSLSANMSMEFVVNAINILTDIFFESKQAPNKMLLVETRISKIVFLNQTFQFVENELSQTSIKKKIDNTFSMISIQTDTEEKEKTDPIEIKDRKQALLVENQKKDTPPQPNTLKPEEKNIPSETSEKNTPTTVSPTAPSTPEIKPKPSNLFSLSNLKDIQSFKQSFTIEQTNQKPSIGLNEENLSKSINKVKDDLSKKGKDQLLDFFKLAEKVIVDEKTLKLITFSNYQQGYIAHNKKEIVSIFQALYSQPDFQLVLEMDEKSLQKQKETKIHKITDTVEVRLKKITDQYPLVQEMINELQLKLEK